MCEIYIIILYIYIFFLHFGNVTEIIQQIIRIYNVSKSEFNVY